jgi:HK97 family phage prohead protease
VGFRAYASITETPYDMWDMFGPYTETIAADAFDATLAAAPDVAYLLNHGGMTLARTTSGTLSIGRDDTGLWYEPRLDPANSDVRNILSGIRRGDLDESSFAFRITSGSWDPSYTAYRIHQLDLHRGDVSTVNYGANPATGAHAISLGLDVDGLDDDDARALADRLEQRAARLRRDGIEHVIDEAHTMSRAELDALAGLAAPHPLAARLAP